MQVSTVLRKIFGSKRDEVIRNWRRLHKEELHDMLSLPNIWVIRSTGMRQAVRVAGMGRRRGAYRVFVWEI
jgi:hypothetical protein